MEAYRQAALNEGPRGNELVQHAQAGCFGHLWVQQVHHIPVPALCFIPNRQAPAVASCTGSPGQAAMSKPQMILIGSRSADIKLEGSLVACSAGRS